MDALGGGVAEAFSERVALALKLDKPVEEGDSTGEDVSVGAATVALTEPVALTLGEARGEGERLWLAVGRALWDTVAQAEGVVEGEGQGEGVREGEGLSDSCAVAVWGGEALPEALPPSALGVGSAEGLPVKEALSLAVEDCDGVTAGEAEAMEGEAESEG